MSRSCLNEKTKMQASEALADQKLKIPNARTRAAMAESQAMMLARAARFTAIEALFNSIAD
jgi:hypothetical protein